MTKFRCQNCGHRIAIPPRHAGKLVRCPECGSMTHPLAEQLASQGDAALAPAQSIKLKQAAAEHQVRHCANCARLIGKLEASHIWQGNVVCDDCHDRFVQAAAAQASGATTSNANATPKARPRSAAFLNRLMPFMSTRPMRVVLALCTIALAIYFVISFIHVIGLLANVIVVGLLLLLALYFLFHSAPAPALTKNAALPKTAAARAASAVQTPASRADA